MQTLLAAARATLIVLVALLPRAASGDFAIETVDSSWPSGSLVAGHLASVRDAQGRIHVAYEHAASATDELRYARKINGAWTIEQVRGEIGMGVRPSIAIDPQGDPHVSHYGSPMGAKDLHYSRKEFGEWTTTTIASVGIVGTFSSIALGSGLSTQIAYYDATAGDLKLAIPWHGSFVSFTVESAGDVGKWPSFALDAQGTPHILYRDETSDRVKYARGPLGSWVIETIADPYFGGYGMSLVLDGQGNPRASYYASNGSDSFVRYASRVGGAWTVELVDSGNSAGTSIAIDPDGNPCISYFGNPYLAGPGNLKFARRVAGVWTKVVVDATIDCGRQSALMLDASGTPYISYNVFPDELRLAVGSPDVTAVGSSPRAGGAISVQPNPCRSDRVGVRFRVPASGVGIDLAVFDMSGRRVKTLLSGTPAVVAIEGGGDVSWDGRDDAGRPVGSGVYFLRVQSGSVAATARLVMLR